MCCGCYQLFTFSCKELDNKTAVSVKQTGEMVSSAELIGSVAGVGGFLLIVIILLVCYFTRKLKKERKKKIIEENPLYNDTTYYQEGYTKDRNTAYY